MVVLALGGWGGVLRVEWRLFFCCRGRRVRRRTQFLMPCLTALGRLGAAVVRAAGGLGLSAWCLSLSSSSSKSKSKSYGASSDWACISDARRASWSR